MNFREALQLLELDTSAGQYDPQNMAKLQGRAASQMNRQQNAVKDYGNVRNELAFLWKQFQAVMSANAAKGPSGQAKNKTILIAMRNKYIPLLMKKNRIVDEPEEAAPAGEVP